MEMTYLVAMLRRSSGGSDFELHAVEAHLDFYIGCMVD
jgi:hypothetical protein